MTGQEWQQCIKTEDITIADRRGIGEPTCCTVRENIMKQDGQRS